MTRRLSHHPGYEIYVTQQTYDRERPQPGRVLLGSSNQDNGLLCLSLLGYRIIVERETGTHADVQAWKAGCIGQCEGASRFYGFTEINDAFAFRLRFG